MAPDTIVAVATPPGRGAIGVVRLSGPQARAIALRVWRASGVKSGTREIVDSTPRSHDFTTSRLHDFTPTARRAYLGSIVDPSTGERIDEGILTYFPAPRSYTGEDVVEISLHGNPLLLERTVALLCEVGARPAAPGEFTQRAYLNGKMDLAQAEAVADLIAASSEAAVRAARRIREGKLSRRIEELRVELLNVLGHTEAAIDFAEEEDVQPRAMHGIAPDLERLEKTLQRVARTYTSGRRLREGARVVIAGEPNVGKSTLMNRLASREVSLTHEQPGTTRDIVRDWIEIEGVPVEIQDTAGLCRTSDPVELEGVHRAQGAMREADVLLWVLDAGHDRGAHSTEAAREWLARANGAAARTLFVLNKIDLLTPETPVASGFTPDGTSPGVKPGATVFPPPLIQSATADGEGQGVRRGADGQWGEPLPELHTRPRPTIPVSARTGEGVEELRREIRRVLAEGPSDGDELTLLRQRHFVAVRKAADHVRSAAADLHRGEPPDLVAVGLREAAAELEEIAGGVHTEEILQRVFSEFCVGK